MTKPNMKHRGAQYLDGRELFEYYWTKMGSARSYEALRRWCLSQGKVNPSTGNPPNRMSILKAMWRWATRKENFDEGYQMVNLVMRDEGKFMSKDEWREVLREKVHVAYQYGSPKEKRFLKKHGYDLQSPNPS